MVYLGPLSKDFPYEHYASNKLGFSVKFVRTLTLNELRDLFVKEKEQMDIGLYVISGVISGDKLMYFDGEKLLEI